MVIYYSILVGRYLVLTPLAPLGRGGVFGIGWVFSVRWTFLLADTVGTLLERNKSFAIFFAAAFHFVYMPLGSLLFIFERKFICIKAQ